MKALLAVIAKSANAAKAMNVIRDVKILDLWERESNFVVILVYLLLSYRCSRLVNPSTTGITGRAWGLSSADL